MMDTNGQNSAERMTCNGRHSGLEDVGGLVRYEKESGAVETRWGVIVVVSLTA